MSLLNEKPSPEEADSAVEKLRDESARRQEMLQIRVDTNARIIPALMTSCGISEEEAKLVVGYVAMEQIPNMFIAYPKPTKHDNLTTH